MMDSWLRLVITAGPDIGREIPLHGDYLAIGRQEDSDIVIRHPKISRKHAVIRRKGAAYLIEDAGSANGTFIDGQRLSADENRPLKPGSTLNLAGEVMLSVQAMPDANTLIGQSVWGQRSSDGLLSDLPTRIEINSVPSSRQSQATSVLQIGQRFGKYEIRNEIGRGAYGRVLLAYETPQKRMVAIKELLRDSDSGESQNFQNSSLRLEREAGLLDRLRHPNIIAFYELIKHQDSVYLILEYAPGGTLKTRLSKVSYFSPEGSVQIAADICRALVELGRQRVVHRDIKPGNILLMEDNTAKLTDFGVAQTEDSSRPVRKHPGTPRYRSPEQDISLEPLTDRSDLYTLGLLLYEMLTGQNYKTTQQPARKLNPAINSTLDKIISKCLQPKPQDRYPNAQELLDALSRAFEHKSLLGRGR